MKVDLNQYRIHIGFLKKFIENHSELSSIQIVRLYNGPSAPPLIVSCYYLLELKGEDPEIRKFIETLKAFYGYTSIEGL